MTLSQTGASAALSKTVPNLSASEIDLSALGTVDPVLQQIAQDVLEQAKYTFTAVAAGAKVSIANDLAPTMTAYIASRKPASRSNYAQKASALLAASPDVRQAQFGRYASIDPAAFVFSDHPTIQARAGAPIFAAKAPHLMTSLSVLASSAAFGVNAQAVAAAQAKAAADAKAAAAAKAAHDKDVADGHKFKTLEFYISDVRCIDNTGGIFEGTDEIAIGGVAVGATGNVHKIKQFHVQDGFDVGVVHKYPGGLSFAQYDIPTAAPWPHEMLVTVAMAELDDGGFGDFLASLWDKVKGAVTAAIGAAIGTAIGAAIGSAIPGLGTVIGAVVGALIGWIVSLFHNADDIVGTKTKSIHLYDATRSYYDSRNLATSAGIPVTIDLHDEGHYQVNGGWRLVHP